MTGFHRQAGWTQHWAEAAASFLAHLSLLTFRTTRSQIGFAQISFPLSLSLSPRNMTKFIFFTESPSSCRATEPKEKHLGGRNWRRAPFAVSRRMSVASRGRGMLLPPGRWSHNMFFAFFSVMFWCSSIPGRHRSGSHCAARLHGLPASSDDCWCFHGRCRGHHT